jgi:hypothetical protein
MIDGLNGDMTKSRNMAHESEEALKKPETNQKCHECFSKLELGRQSYNNILEQWEAALEKVVSSGGSEEEIKTGSKNTKKYFEPILKSTAKISNDCNDECIVGYKSMHKVRNYIFILFFELYFRTPAVIGKYIHFSK